MTERRLLSLIITLVLTTPAAQAEGLGRLFFTPAQRTQLDHHNYRPTPAVTNTDTVAAPEENDRSLTVNGIVQRNGGKRTAWINGVERAVGQSDDNTSVMVNLPDQNKIVRLKVGQRILLSPAVSPTKSTIEKQDAPSDD
jgi:hypothetical protein